MSFLFEPKYAAALVSDPPTAIAAGMALLTHATMLFADAYAFNARHFRLATVGLASLVISMQYHACRASVACLGVPVGTWRLQDHMFVLWVLGEIGLHLFMGSLTSKAGRSFFVVMGYLVFPVGSLAVNLFPYSLLSGLLMALFLAVAGAVRLSLYLCAAQPDELLPQGQTSDRLTLFWLLVALSSMALAFVFYCLDDEDAGYAGNSPIDAVAHDIWHATSGVALFAASAAVSYRTEAALRERQHDAFSY